MRIDAYDGPAGKEIVADAGRAILGGETFRVRTSRGRDLVVVFRTSPAVEARVTRPPALGLSGPPALEIEIPEAGIIVRAGNRSFPSVTFRNVRGWNEHVLRVSGDALTEGETALVLRGRYGSFHYWFYQ